MAAGSFVYNVREEQIYVTAGRSSPSNFQLG